MNRITKTMRKGFTLMELMVVMAIMSILLVAVMSMTTPASRIFKRTAVSDNVYSAADNITGYLQRTLEYADNVWIFDSAEPEANDLKKTALSFKNCYYKNVIKGTGTAVTNYKFVKGKVHILHLSNETGKIDETIYAFSDSTSDSLSLEKNAVDVLNPNYFKGDYADYNFRYVLGASTLEPVDDAGERKMSGTEIVYCLKSEKENATVISDISHQAITLVANRSTSKPQKVDGVYEFVGPCVATVANLPFTNIASRRSSDGSPTPNAPVYRLCVPGVTSSSPVSSDIHSQNDAIAADYRIIYDRQAAVGVSTPSPTITRSLSNLAAGNPITFGDGTMSNDIYFVFAYADELVTPT